MERVYQIFVTLERSIKFMAFESNKDEAPRSSIFNITNIFPDKNYSNMKNLNPFNNIKYKPLRNEKYEIL